MHRAPTPLPDDHEPVREDDPVPGAPGVPPPEDDPVPDHNPTHGLRLAAAGLEVA